MARPKYPQTIDFHGRYLDLRALATLSGCSKSYLSHIFRGRRVPSVKLARKIAHHLMMNLDEFILALDAREAERQRRQNVYAE